MRGLSIPAMAMTPSQIVSSPATSGRRHHEPRADARRQHAEAPRQHDERRRDRRQREPRLERAATGD